MPPADRSTSPEVPAERLTASGEHGSGQVLRPQAEQRKDEGRTDEGRTDEGSSGPSSPPAAPLPPWPFVLVPSLPSFSLTPPSVKSAPELC